MLLVFFKGFFKVLLWLLIVAILLVCAALVVCLPVAWLDWTPGEGLLLLAAIIAGGFFVWYLRRARRIRRETRLFDATTNAAADAQTQKKEAYSRVRTLWSGVLHSLRTTQLAQKGNPLYAQPWGVILGGAGVGKTQAVRSSRLVNNLGVGGSRLSGEDLPCSVWFLRDIALIDPKGEKTGTGEANSDFEYLLDMLAASRSREPLNCVVLTIGADDLLKWHADDLQLYGRQLSCEVDGIYRRFGCSIPIYVLVTKLDRIYGMRELAQALPDSILSQAMGCVNPAPNRPAEGFLDESFEDMTRHLRHLRLHMAYTGDGDQAAISAAPDGFSMLLPGLRAFIRGVFTVNPYLHPLAMRGLFFGAGCNEGEPLSLKLQELGIQPPAKDPEEEDWSRENRLVMFLGDFFGKILPADRGYFRPLPEYARINAIKNNLGALVALCIGFACSLGLSAAFLKQYSVLHAITNNSTWQALPDYPPAQIRQIPDDQELARVLYQLSSLDKQLKNLQQQERGLWWTRPFMLGGVNALQRQLEKSYARQFRQYVINVIDLRINKDDPLTKSGQNAAERTGAYYEYIVRRCNLSRLAAQEQIAPAVFQKYPAPTASILRALGSQLPIDAELSLPELYQRYYLCQHDKALLHDEAQALNRELIALLRTGPRTLDWLTPWANQLDQLADVNLQQFWNATGGLQQGDQVAVLCIQRGYTAQGSREILSFVQQIQDAVLSVRMDEVERQSLVADINQRAAAAFKLYKQQTYAAWLDFAGKMRLGRILLTSEDEFSFVAGNCAALNGPYEHFLDRMLSELYIIAANDIQQLPNWIRLVSQYRKLRLEASTTRLVGSSASIAGAAVNYATQVENMLRQQPSPLVMPQTAPNPSSAFAAYCKGLLQSGPPPGNLIREVAYGKASVLFGGKGTLPTTDPETSPPAGDAKPTSQQNQSLKQAVDGFLLLQRAMQYTNATAEEQVVWSCIRGPLDLVTDYNLFEAGRVVNKFWSDTVLADISSVPPLQVPEELFGKKQGRVWSWLKGAAPFFASDTANNFLPKIVAGYRFPLIYAQVSPVLTKGARGAWGLKQQYSLSVTAQPVDVNERANTLPTGVTLTLFAVDGPQTMRNLNYSSSRTFIWKPSEGGRTELRIEFPSFALIKTYDGPYGFARFCGDFARGTHVFTQADFPDAAQLLRDMCISYLKVSYVFDSQQMEPIVRINSLFDVSVPAQVAPDFAQWQQDFRDQNLTKNGAPISTHVDTIHFAPISNDGTRLQPITGDQNAKAFEGQVTPASIKNESIAPEAALVPAVTQNAMAAPADPNRSEKPRAANTASVPQQAVQSAQNAQNSRPLFGTHNEITANKVAIRPAQITASPEMCEAGANTTGAKPGNVYVNTTTQAAGATTNGQQVVINTVMDLPELNDSRIPLASSAAYQEPVIIVDKIPEKPVPGRVYMLRSAIAEISCEQEPMMQLPAPVYAGH